MATLIHIYRHLPAILYIQIRVFFISLKYVPGGSTGKTSMVLLMTWWKRICHWTYDDPLMWYMSSGLNELIIWYELSLLQNWNEGPYLIYNLLIIINFCVTNMLSNLFTLYFCLTWFWPGLFQIQYIPDTVYYRCWIIWMTNWICSKLLAHWPCTSSQVVSHCQMLHICACWVIR